MKTTNTNFCLPVILGILLFASFLEAKKCKVILNELADAQMQFVGCMVRESSPAESCKSCFLHHTNMVLNYNNLVSNETCLKEVINKNRLNIAYNTQKQLMDLWNKAFCDDCFENGVISNQTTKFFNSADDVSTCVNTKPLDNICIKCAPFYDDLNTFYKQMDEEKQGKICFDIQDKMNRTRSLWSKDLKCCQRKYNLVFFIIASSMFGALTIVFYFGIYSYTKRMERNHEVLDAGHNTDIASTSAIVQSSRTSSDQNRKLQSESSSDEDIVDELKKPRDVPSRETTSQQNTVPSKQISKPTSSNTAGCLIEL